MRWRSAWAGEHPKFAQSRPHRHTPTHPSPIPPIRLKRLNPTDTTTDSCCLQVTFQARDLSESRYLYDQLAVMAPLMMALTANAPIWRGRLADTDTRWDVISAATDCRTPAERGVEAAPGTGAGGEAPAPWMELPLAGTAAGGGRRRIAKSRYSSIDCFISEDTERLPDSYNDLPLQLDAATLEMCRAGGVDERLSRHIANLFVRDPLVVFKGRVEELDDKHSVEHFENVQSTNWRSMRWKPPPADKPGIGWRVELRTMEAQITDFENAAFAVFVALLSRVMLFFDLNLLVPLSKVDENFARASTRRAASRQKFWFRRRITERRCSAPAAPAAAQAPAAAAGNAQPASAGFDLGCGCPSAPAPQDGDAPQAEYEEMTLAEILLGRAADPDCPGLVPLVHLYLDFIGCDAETRELVEGYLRLIVGRATGDVQTGATWQRAFVRAHAEYRGDGVVPPAVAADLLREVLAVVEGRVAAPELRGSEAPPPIVVTDEFLARLESETERGPAVALHVLASEAAASAAAAEAASAAEAAGMASAAQQEPNRPLRGASFVDEVGDLRFECAALSRIVERYKEKWSLSPHSPSLQGTWSRGDAAATTRPALPETWRL